MADAPVSPRSRHVDLTRIFVERLNGADSRVPKSYLARMLSEKDDCEMPTAHFDLAM
jgi:hypothetical protein